MAIRLKTFFLLISFSVFLTACLPGQSPVQTSPDQSRIAFYTHRDGNLEIYTMNAEGGDLRRITNNAFNDDSPSLSPDGSQIVFLSDRDDPQPGSCAPNCLYQLYLIQADGSGEHKLVDIEFSTMHPDWHPDGSLISFDTEFKLQGDIYVVNADGTGLRLLIEDGFWADWSPDGSRLVFASNRDGNVELYLANADGGSQVRLTKNLSFDYFPAWSPDGEWIAYATVQQKEIFVINVDSGDVHQITTQGRCENPAWSPNGSYIAYQSSSDGDFEIYAIHFLDALQNPGEVEAIILTDNGTGDLWPSWSAIRD